MASADSAALTGNWKALLVTPNKTIAGELSPILAQHLPSAQVFEMQAYPARQVLAELGGAQGPNLCFLDLISDPERALGLIAELMAIQPSIKIIVLLSSKNPDIILRAMRQGAAEFLVRPFDPGQLDHALDRIATLHRGSGAAQRGKVITVVPAKGACGATTVASNLAQHYRRAGHKKILLADMDPLTGTLSFLMKLKSNYSFIDALSRSTSLDADIWKGIVTQQTGGLDILVAPDIVNEGLHDLRDASSILDFARGFYDVVVLDTGSAYGDWNLSLARRSDEVLLITTNELPALQASQRAMNYFEANHITRSQIRLVVNRYNKELGLSREVIETALHCDVYNLLPADYESIHRALIEGKPVASSSNFGKSLAQLADRLVPRPAGTEAARKPSALSGLFSMFTRTSPGRST